MNTPYHSRLTGFKFRKSMAGFVYGSLLWAGGIMNLSGATLLFDEKFVGDSTKNTWVDTIGWEAYNSAGANISKTVNSGVLISNFQGVNSGAGYLAFNSTGAFAAMKSGFNFNPAAGALTFSWSQLDHENAVKNVRLMVQVGGNWYASNSVFDATDGGASSVAPWTTSSSFNFNYTISSSAWRLVTLVQGSSLTLGATTITSNLPNSAITGIGYYYDGSSTVRIDNLQVTQVPEPAVAGLAAVGIVSLMMRRRRVRL